MEPNFFTSSFEPWWPTIAFCVIIWAILIYKAKQIARTKEHRRSINLGSGVHLRRFALSVLLAIANFLIVEFTLPYGDGLAMILVLGVTLSIVYLTRRFIDLKL